MKNTGETLWAFMESQKPSKKIWKLLSIHGVKGLHQGQFSDAFVTLVLLHFDNTNSTFNVSGYRKINMTLWSSAKYQHLGIAEGIGFICWKHFFKTLKCFNLVTHRRALFFSVSEVPAQKVKNVSCLLPYEVLYRNRPHPSSLRVLSEMVRE